MQKNKTKLLSYIIHKKVNSKWIKDLNVEPETTKLLEEKLGCKLNIGLENDFFRFDTKIRGNKSKSK